MPLGTLDRSPPPFFRQGPSALTRVIFFASLALCLMAADSRYAVTQPLRVVVAAVLHPLERLLLAPVRALGAGSDYLGGINQALGQVEQAQTRMAEQSRRLLQVQALELENVRLRALLALRERLNGEGRTAEVLYNAPDPYTRKVVLGSGSGQGIEAGSPVIDERGVLGQVTRVYPMSAEVTLLNDRDAAIAVLNGRTQQRGVAYGDPTSGGMELRFVAANADVQPGDLLSTTGLDGIFPSGLAVAKVARVDRRADSAFARIVLAPVAPLDAIRHVLVLAPEAKQLPPRPEASPARDDKALKTGRRPGR
ncbi:MAG: rod shape-determining protein MreC [Burkholderiales bacterium]